MKDKSSKSYKKVDFKDLSNIDSKHTKKILTHELRLQLSKYDGKFDERSLDGIKKDRSTFFSHVTLFVSYPRFRFSR